MHFTFIHLSKPLLTSLLSQRNETDPEVEIEIVQVAAMIETVEDVVVDPETEEDGTTEMIDDIMTDEVRLAEDLSQQLDQIEIPPTIALSSKCDQEALVPDHHRG